MMLRFTILASSLLSVAAAGLCATYEHATPAFICNNFERRCLSKGTPKDQCTAKATECKNFPYTCFVKPLIANGTGGPSTWSMCCDGAQQERSREFVTGYEGVCEYQEGDSKTKATSMYKCRQGETNFDFHSTF